VFSSVIVILISSLGFKKTLKPIVIFLLLVSSITGYFMNSYNTVINDAMIQNILSSDINEAKDLINIKLIAYFLFLGCFPAFIIYEIKIDYQSVFKELFTRVKIILFLFLSSGILIYIFSDFYSSFIRENKQLRYYANPSYYLYSTIQYINDELSNKIKEKEIKKLGENARIPIADNDRELIIFVVGETARADKFSLNGYGRETNPLLKNENIVSFSNFWSCGTSTAVSVPCMFSIYNELDYQKGKAQSTENVLDILKHAGVNVLWLDNNSDSKGVAERIEYQSYKTSTTNPVCDTECRDIGMLSHLQDYIKKHQQGDIFIVLHQMGQHGPAYYKRYPLEFEKFKPVCKTNQLENCSQEELNNTYDNAILYTDYFLSEVIQFLKNYDKNFETGMLYVSDHGESLGENGIYLHGLPNFIAPDTQRHVPVILWAGENYDEVNISEITKKQHKKYTHDNIFHTILGLLEIEVPEYIQKMDIVNN
jgi:lipid A ethanolaminephosphotransferase